MGSEKLLTVVDPKIFHDERGYFFPGRGGVNQSGSRRNVIRGLHYQYKFQQEKFVRVISGEVFDVSVDLREWSPTFGKWEGVVLSSSNRKQAIIPMGCAHGFLVLSDWAEVLYRVDGAWVPEDEYVLSWNDKSINVEWPLTGDPIISFRDKNGSSFTECPKF
jgi:dTDP-4-dehydrorhamnose 3,5-epimerase